MTTTNNQESSLQLNTKKGLFNLGNTCYMNSLLQCLIRQPDFVFLYLSGQFHCYLPNGQKFNTLSKTVQSFLIDYYLSDSSKQLNPSPIKRIIGSLNKTFADNTQQDSSEFLSTFMDRLISESSGYFSFISSNSLQVPSFFGTKLLRKIDGVDDKAREAYISEKWEKLKILKETSSALHSDSLQKLLKEDFLTSVQESKPFKFLNQEEARQIAKKSCFILGISSEDSPLEIPDSLLSKFSWAGFHVFNNSPLISTFYFQTKNELYCSSCDFREISFDPLAGLNLDIPTTEHSNNPESVASDFKTINAIVVFNHHQATPSFSACFQLSNETIAKEFYIQLSSKAQMLSIQEKRRNENRPESLFQLAAVSHGRIIHLFEDSEKVSVFCEYSDLFLYEVESTDSSKYRYIPLYFTTNASNVEYANFLFGANSELTTVGKWPVLLTVPREGFVEAVHIAVFRKVEELLQSKVSEGERSDITIEGINDIVKSWTIEYCNFDSWTLKSPSIKFPEFSILFDYLQEEQSKSLFPESIESVPKEKLPLLEEIFENIVSSGLRSGLQSDLSISVHSEDATIKALYDGFQLIQTDQSLEPDKKPETHISKALANKEGITLKTCINNYLASEKIHSDFRVSCSFCKRPGFIVKKTELWNPPRNLVICLKRFKFNKYSTKVLTDVGIPDELELDEFFKSAWNEKGVRYRLNGICCHYGGGVHSGHYMAFCRVQGRWVKFNDENVGFSEPDKRNAYIVFYERV